MRLYRVDDLKSSRVFFDKKPPAFLSFFVLGVLIFLISSVLILIFLPKNYFVEAQGIVTTEDNTFIGSHSDGVVVEIKKKENEWVNKEDVILVLSNGNEGIQIKALQKQLDQAYKKIEAMNLFEKSLFDEVNYLNNSDVQQEYYGKMEYYLSFLVGEKNNIANQLKDKEKKKKSRDQKKEEIIKLEKMLNDLIGTNDLNDLEMQIKIKELEEEIGSKRSEIKTLEEEIEELSRETSLSQIEQTRMQFLSELGSSRTVEESNIVELESQIDIYKRQDELIEIKSSKQGYIHYLESIKDGISIQRNQTVAEISKNEKSHMIVEAYIYANDRLKVHINDEVKVVIQGVNTQKYGTLDGKLYHIDNGTITQGTNNGNIVLYKCKIKIFQTELFSTKGEKIEVVKSMPVIARIVYDKETYMDWLLEILNFKN